MSNGLPVDAVALREEVKTKYSAVAINPHSGYHFHTGRPLARRLGYDDAVVARMPDCAIEAFAGVGNPFSHGALGPGERVVDLGSGGGFDCFIAAEQVGAEGHVIGDGPRQCRVSPGRHRGFARRDRLGGCRHQQRRHQPVRRQTPRLRRDHPGAEAGRTLAVRRHRNRKGRAGSGDPQHRPLD